MQKVFLIFIITFFLWASLLTAKEEEGFKIGDPAPKFILKDPEDKEYSLELLLKNKKILVLMLGDPKVRKECNEWGNGLHEVYGKREDIVLLMIADLRGLPFFVTESMVKWGTKKESLPVTILLDWKGKISEKLKAYRSKPNIFILDSEGKVLFHQFGPFSADLVKKIQDKVTEISKGKSQ